MYISVSDGDKKGKQTFPAGLLFPEMWLALQKSFSLRFPTGAAPMLSAPYLQGLEATAWLRVRGLGSSATRDRQGGEKEAAAGRWKGWSRRPERGFFETLCALLDLFHG